MDETLSKTVFVCGCGPVTSDEQLMICTWQGGSHR